MADDPGGITGVVPTEEETMELQFSWTYRPLEMMGLPCTPVVCTLVATVLPELVSCARAWVAPTMLPLRE